jgi:hypothetical protein
MTSCPRNTRLLCLLLSMPKECSLHLLSLLTVRVLCNGFMKLVALHLRRTHLLIRVVGIPSNLFDQRLVDSFSRFHCIHTEVCTFLQCKVCTRPLTINSVHCQSCYCCCCSRRQTGSRNCWAVNDQELHQHLLIYCTKSLVTLFLAMMMIAATFIVST